MLHIVASLIATAHAAVASIESHLATIGEKFKRLVGHPQAPVELRDALPSIEHTLNAHTEALRNLTQAVAELHDAVVPGALAINVPRQLVTATQAAAVDETHGEDGRLMPAGPAPDTLPSTTEPAAA